MRRNRRVATTCQWTNRIGFVIGPVGRTHLAGLDTGPVNSSKFVSLDTGPVNIIDPTF